MYRVVRATGKEPKRIKNWQQNGVGQGRSTSGGENLTRVNEKQKDSSSSATGVKNEVYDRSRGNIDEIVGQIKNDEI